MQTAEGPFHIIVFLPCTFTFPTGTRGRQIQPE